MQRHSNGWPLPTRRSTRWIRAAWASRFLSCVQGRCSDLSRRAFRSPRRAGGSESDHIFSSNRGSRHSTGFERRHIDHEPITYIAILHPIVGLVNLPDWDHLDIGSDAILAAKIEHLLR